MKIKVEERERNACRIRSKLPFSVAKHRGSETRGSEMSVIPNSFAQPQYKIIIISISKESKNISETF